MKRILAAAVIAAITTPVSAEAKYDRSIDEAAARILAEKIGDIRGSFAPGEEPVFVPERRADLAGPSTVNWPDGLVRARDPHAATSISF